VPPLREDGALRIVHVNTERTWGGGERQLHALAVELRRRGHRSWAAVRPRTRLAAALACDGVPVVTLSPFLEWDPVAVARLRSLLRRVGAQIVHAHAAHAVAPAALACAGTGARLLVARRVAHRLRRNPLSRWKYARTCRFIAVSDRVRAALRACGVAAARITVVHSGLDLRRTVSRASPDTLRALGVRSGPALVVMVSSLVPPHKDPETFVAAIAAARAAGSDVQALLIGEGPLAARARGAVRRMGLDGFVRLTGYRGDAEEILAAADVAVLSSRDEGLGTTLLDAMAAGVPVAATDAGGVREVVRNGIDGLLAPIGDGPALGAAIARIVGDADLREALRRAGRDRVREFSLDRTVEGTLEVYWAVTGRGVNVGVDG
jgi:glycosyltransferase involved in cell wall biosynthesis